MKAFLTLIVLFIFAACTPSSDRAISAIEDMGLTNVNLGEHDVLGWSCPENMGLNITFSALQPINQRQVSGIVCCDYWGACTVRTR